jgi:orotate phosphoribosyltransferase
MSTDPTGPRTAAADAAHHALVAHLLEHSVRRGDFTLKSGRKSSWFIDSKQTVCRPEGIRLVADAALAVIASATEAAVDAIGGLTMGADPVAFGIAAIAAERGWPLRSFSIRKEAKGHGVEGRLAGALLAGDRAVITEDTVTRGTSALDAALVARELGADPVMILVVVDRGGTCEAMAKAEGIAFHALVTALDLGFDYEGA